MGIAYVGTELDMYILGFQQVGMDLIVKGEQQQSIDLDMLVFTNQLIPMDMDLLVVAELPYRFIRVRKDLSTRYFGGFASDSNFFEGFDPPNGGAVITNDIGAFSSGHRKLVFSAPNTIPTGGAFDKYSLPLNAGVTLNTIGFRALVNFRLDTFGNDSNLLFGFFNDQLDPLANIAGGDICAFAFETEKGHIEFRAWYGTSSSALNIGTALPLSRFLNKELLVEIEVVDSGALGIVEFSLYEMNTSLSTPIFKETIESAAFPTVDRFSITSLGQRVPEGAASYMSVAFQYVDVELATGVVYDTAAGIPIARAKWRPLQDRPPIELLQEGNNQLFVALSPDGIVTNTETDDTIFVDSSDPQITIIAFIPESTLIVPGSVTPPVVKGSLNAGFDEVTVIWSASHAGTYSLRADSTSPTDGTEILSGSYPIVGSQIATAWNFADLPDLDGTHDVTLYLIADTGKHAAKKLGIFILPTGPRGVQASMNVSIVA